MLLVVDQDRWFTDVEDAQTIVAFALIAENAQRMVMAGKLKQRLSLHLAENKSNAN
jgi:hypothetical protein